MVFELDDQFDSYSDAVTMTSLQYEMHLNERGQKVDSVQRMTASGNEPAPADATAARVLPGTRDPLGMMQYLRNVDWAKTPEVRSPVYDGHKLYDVRARRVGTPADEGCLLPLVPREQRGADAGASRSDDAVRDGARGAAESELRNPESKGDAARLRPAQSLARL